MARIQFEKTIRGVDVLVTAEHFVEDRSVGMFLGPEEVSAESADGQPFELTDREEEDLGIEATDRFLQREADVDWR